MCSGGGEGGEGRGDGGDCLRDRGGGRGDGGCLRDRGRDRRNGGCGSCTRCLSS